MTQTLSPTFGEFITDQSIARTSAQRPGWTCRGTIEVTANATTPANWDIKITPSSDTGFFAWRTKWTKAEGAFHILEDATVTVATGVTAPSAGKTTYVLVLGRWKWVEGPFGTDGSTPTGVLTDAQKAIYAAISGTASATPVDPTITPDTGGRYDVVLARVVLAYGATPVVEWLPETDLDLASMGTTLAETVELLASHTHPTLYQPLDADLTSIAGQSGTAGFLKKTGANTWTLDTSAYSLTSHTHTATGISDSSAAGRALLTAASVASQRTALELGTAAIADIGTAAGDVADGAHTHATTYQPLDADLSAIAALSATAGHLKKTGTNTWVIDTTAYAEATHAHEGPDVTYVDGSNEYRLSVVAGVLTQTKV